MQLSSLRPVTQLAISAVLAYRSRPSASLPVAAAWTVVIYVLIATFIILPYHYFIYLPFLSPLRGIPSPPPGLNTWRTWLAAEPSPPQLLAWVKAVQKEHGPSFRGVMRYYGIGGSERLLLASPAALKEVLVTKQYDFFDRPTMARKRIAVQAGNGLIASGGDEHKQQKRKLMPAFSSRAIKDLYPLFWTKANELVYSLRKDLQSRGSSSVDLLSWTSRSALDIIGVAAWGKDFGGISNPDSDFLKSYSAMFDISGGGQLVNALALALPMSLVLQLPLPYNKRLKAALQSVRQQCRNAVREKQQNKQAATDKDILSLLIRGGINDEEALVDQMMTMLAAGHDTSSLSLVWGCYLLSKHPEVQTRLREELRTVLPSGNGGTDDYTLTPETFESLTYLQAVANEILRLMPAVPVTRRETLQPTTIQEYYIPRGGHAVASGWVANRLESEWGDDAEQFVVERWLDGAKNENSGANNKFAFHSFSHGARACIGQGFARGEFLVFLAALVSNFKMELAEPGKEPVALFGITMSPAGGIKIKLGEVK